MLQEIMRVSIDSGENGWMLEGRGLENGETWENHKLWDYGSRVRTPGVIDSELLMWLADTLCALRDNRSRPYAWLYWITSQN